MTRREEAFKRAVWTHYHSHGRDLPWRHTRDPYAILVSEFMLQQTQVSRVIERYPRFLEQFPTTGHIARARLSTILRAWQGLGYNRRAKMLKQACERIQSEYNGNVPHTFEELTVLAGVGQSTASAVLAFAFNVPTPFIETNIRRAYLHHFFPKKEQVSDATLKPIIARTVDGENPREWFWALMDYGAMLPKRLKTNPNAKSAHHTRQSPFAGSHRQARGAIIRTLSKQSQTQQGIIHDTKLTKARIIPALNELMQEGFIKKKGSEYTLA